MGFWCRTSEQCSQEYPSHIIDELADDFGIGRDFQLGYEQLWGSRGYIGRIKAGVHGDDLVGIM